MAVKALYWFTNDLRLHDNPILHQAYEHCDSLLCVYFMEPQKQQFNRYQLVSVGEIRHRFLLQALQALQSNLATLGQRLLVMQADPMLSMPVLIEQYGINLIYRSRHCGWYEQQQWRYLKQCYPHLRFVEVDTHTLYSQDQLPFPLSDMPKSYSKFRKQIEQNTTVFSPLLVPDYLPPQPNVFCSDYLDIRHVHISDNDQVEWHGGENAALMHLQQYFSSSLPSNYKETRNAIEGWDNSTKFSPWLASGALSAKMIMATLLDYEKYKEKNSSTYWIFFELLWREFFQWHAHAVGRDLYRFSGVQNKRLLNSFYPTRFKQWCEGSTPYPIVNAFMKQLNQTGYMSNRGRQIVASCLVNELSVDWRYGAAYFEQQLIDHDVAANWGNWQYIAGVGTDSREKRWFDLEKQTRIFDPNHHFIRHWRGDENLNALDSVNIDDWPLSGRG
ncbi:FAD-binding protein [Photobacterium angustum]|uniref:DASH family cryptochrome n=1 Tax=Photobacterium angustum TaxID=661 RepID=UPI0005E65BF0|nr:DASH family cryptochrome [Photobacterium angustum]KJF94285.1 FAD-binding protein [Photobacterium angustum]KJG06389.1 FAD-binding protein [Photobacterium angustum]PSV94191.1 DASH family cryptochrome [Photobacterium angustum]PSW78498.1 DASH family cryptochrome [Photobacterium angustum]